MRTIPAEELKAIIDKHHKYLRSEPGGERANLSSANLSSADLRSANLSYADLRYADLRYANLSYADLRYADLRSANLSSADLSSADLRSANLRSANLSYADLRSANLRSADLSSANLSSADLRSANLSSANLSSANLSSANLSSADLRSANLSYADLRSIKTDFFERLAFAKAEVIGLYDALQKGRIDGTSYSGECACFAGTIANLRGENAGSVRQLTNGLKVDSDSPTERWFLAILKGDTPQSNPVADITALWIEEFAKDNSLALPKYKIISSAEFPNAFEQMKSVEIG